MLNQPILLHFSYKLDIYNIIQSPLTKCTMIVFTNQSIYIVQNIAYMFIHTPNPLSLAKANNKTHTHLLFSITYVLYFSLVSFPTKNPIYIFSFAHRQLLTDNCSATELLKTVSQFGWQFKRPHSVRSLCALLEMFMFLKSIVVSVEVDEIKFKVMEISTEVNKYQLNWTKNKKYFYSSILKHIIGVMAPDIEHQDRTLIIVLEKTPLVALCRRIQWCLFCFLLTIFYVLVRLLIWSGEFNYASSLTNVSLFC